MHPTYEQIDRWAGLPAAASLPDVLRRLPDRQVARMTWAVDVVQAVKKRRNKPPAPSPPSNPYL